MLGGMDPEMLVFPDLFQGDLKSLGRFNPVAYHDTVFDPATKVKKLIGDVPRKDYQRMV